MHTPPFALLTPFLRPLAWAALALPQWVGAQVLDAGAWRFNIGAGLSAQPDFAGSSGTRVKLMPSFSARKGRWQLGAIPGAGDALGVGYGLLEEGPWRLGAGLATSLNPSRSANDVSGLGEIGRTALGSLTGSYTQGAVAASAQVISDVGGNHQGTQAQFDLMFVARPTERLSFQAGPGITLADGQYTQTHFGVSSAQSASSGVPAFSASGGLNAVRFGVGADYKLTQDWSLGARLSISRLQGDAASSPTTSKRTQTSLGLSVNHSF